MEALRGQLAAAEADVARLAEEREPEVAALLQQACLVPEAYASKWLIGLCVHVLPFRALFDYVEASLELGRARTGVVKCPLFKRCTPRECPNHAPDHGRYS